MAAKEAPILSVLMPTYNYAEFIEDAIRSVFEQDAPPFELVVADDGSDDDTEARVRSWCEREAVVYVRQSNAGPAAARNLAMQEASGQYFMLLDSDDTLLPGCIARAVDCFERFSDVGLFFANYDIYDDEGIVHASGVDCWKVFREIDHREETPSWWLFTESLAPYILEHGAFMHTSGLCFRRELYERVGGFREGFHYAEDDDFYARLAHVTNAAYSDELLSRKRNHSRSLIHDRAHSLRNAKHLVDLTEIQLEYFEGDHRVHGILREKLARTAAGYCWNLIESGDAALAQRTAARFLGRYPGRLDFAKLWMKAQMRRLSSSS